MIKKRIVCLANSKLKGDRCIAGKDVESENWIRPVKEPGVGLSWSERRYEDGNDPKLLDIIEVSLVKPCPHNHHSENWLLDSASLFERKGSLDYSNLDNLTDDPEYLWGNELQKDRISLDGIGNCSCSLYFIKVQEMFLSVGKNSVGYKEVRGRFPYCGDNYALVVTDPKIKDYYIRREFGEYSIGECYVTVSLAAEPWSRAYYKLIAAIITPERAGE